MKKIILISLLLSFNFLYAIGISLNSPTVNEGNTSVTLTATLSAKLDHNITITLSNGATVEMENNTTVGTSTTFTAGTDDVYTLDQSFDINITSDTNGTLTYDLNSTVTVVNVNDTTNLTLTDPSVTEGEANVVIDLNVSNAPVGDLNITINDGINEQNVTIPNGSTGVTATIDLSSYNDVYSTDKTITVNVTGTSGGTFEDLNTTDTSVISMTENNNSVTNLTLTDHTVTEGEANVVIDLNVSNAPVGDLNITINDGINEQNVTIPNGSTGVTATIDLSSYNDVYSTDKTITVNVTGTSGGTFEDLNTTDTSVISMTENNNSVEVVSTLVVVDSNSTDMTYKVELSEVATGDVSVSLDNGDTRIVSDTTSSTTFSVDINSTQPTKITDTTGPASVEFENLNIKYAVLLQNNGWNFISLNGSTVSDVNLTLSDINSSGNIVSLYKEGKRDSNALFTEQNITTITLAQAYWIETSAANVIIDYNTSGVFTDLDYTDYDAGWNAIGFSEVITKESLESNLTAQGYILDEFKSQDTPAPTFVDANYTVPGKAYWIKVQQRAPIITTKDGYIVDLYLDSDASLIELAASIGAVNADELDSALINYEDVRTLAVKTNETNGISTSFMDPNDVNFTLALDSNLSKVTVKEPLMMAFNGFVDDDKQTGYIIENILSDAQGTINSISLTGSSDFNISNSGDLTVVADINYTTTSNIKDYNLTAYATNENGNGRSVDVTIHLSELEPILDMDTLDIKETAVAGTKIGLVPVLFTGSSAITSFTLSGAISSAFTIDNSSGMVSLAIDANSSMNDDIQVVATNTSGDSNIIDITFNVIPMTNAFHIAPNMDNNITKFTACSTERSVSYSMSATMVSDGGDNNFTDPKYVYTWSHDYDSNISTCSTSNCEVVVDYTALDYYGGLTIELNVEYDSTDSYSEYIDLGAIEHTTEYPPCMPKVLESETIIRP